MSRVSVLGDGGWGTALSLILESGGHDVTLWSVFPEYAAILAEKRENVKFLPGISLPEGLKITADTKQVLGADLIIVAVPTKFIRAVLERFPDGFGSGTDVISVAKGIEHDTLMRPTEIIRELAGCVPGVLCGPSHAEEVARSLPAAIVAAAEDGALADRTQALFAGGALRVYTSTDLIGVELGGAFKNVIAIAAGICDGLELGDNAKSAVMTRGLEEMSRLGAAMGAQRSTFFGLSGIGDLITTCTSPFGRNRQVGIRLGRGEKLNDIPAQTATVAEGVLTAGSVCTLADRHGVEVPISREVNAVAFEGKPPMEAVSALMSRDTSAEFFN
ncbi:MAG: NAD(P)-dependent glycerol-3-phosphate dehydrogenase [Candidatus Hydrogenedentes bacterium]|nr:NAD(P)-dependent glycerol-3-phosphate dehydrogenase [Candidatus Hydrogenedentota bacterium]